MRPSTILSFLALALPFSSATSKPHSKRHHHELANRMRGDVDVHKRDAFVGVRFTFYDVGLGACGAWNNPWDHIVALNVEQFGPGYPGEYCFKPITIQYNGVTIRATVTDKCMGCPWGALDFSRGLFDIFAQESEGVLWGDWWFDDE